MGRPAKPKEIHRIQGTIRPDRHHRRDELDLVSREIPPCPDWLGQHAKDEWERLLADSSYRKALRAADFTSLAIYCQMWGKFVESESGRWTEPLTSAYISTMISLGGKLGLNPADRVKVRAPEEQKQSTEWSNFRTLRKP